MWHLPATTVAGRGLMWPDAGGRWLPVWLPQFVSSANLQRARTEAWNSPLLRPEWPTGSDRGQRASMPSHEAFDQRTRPPDDTPTHHRFGVRSDSSRLRATADPKIALSP